MLQEIELTEVTLKADSTLDWCAKYKRDMGVAIFHLNQMYATCRSWLLQTDEIQDDVNVYSDKNATRVHGIVKGRADRYAHILRDPDPATRLRWDSYLKQIQQLETYSDFEGDLYVIRGTLALGASLFGLVWANYNGNKRTHRLVFTSSTHHTHTHYTEYPATNATIGVWLKWLGPEEDATEITILISSSATLNASALRAYVLLLQSVVQEWDTFYPPTVDPKKIENRR
jgi:hypothetical protein